MRPSLSATLGKQAVRAESAGCGGSFETVDQSPVIILEHGEVRVFAGEVDDLPVIFDCLPGIPSQLMHQAEPGVSVVNVREAFEQQVCGLFRLVEPAGVDELDDSVGGFDQLVIAVVAEAAMIMVIIGWRDGCSSDQLAFKLRILGQAATLVFLATTARAGFIASDFGHFSISA